MNIKKNILYGKIIKMSNKTIIVVINKIKKHNIYKKFIRYKKKIMVHNDKNLNKIGDVVKIKNCRPISKKKFHTLI